MKSIPILFVIFSAVFTVYSYNTTTDCYGCLHYAYSATKYCV